MAGKTSAPIKPRSGRHKALPAPKVVESAAEPEISVTEPPEYIRSELAGHAIRMAENTPVEPYFTVDAASGEIVDNPAVLILRDDTERYYTHSFVKQIAGCSAQALFKKQGAPTRPAFALERGSAVHTAIERYVKEGKDPIETFNGEWELNVLGKAKDMSEKDQQKIDFGYRETKLMIEDFVIENDPLIKAGRTESEIEFSLVITIQTEQGSFKRRIYGKIDWIVWNDTRTAYQIHDFKSGATAPNDEELDRDTQFAIYQAAMTEKYGYPPDLMYWYHLKGKNLSGKQWSKANPRDLGQMQYAFDVTVKTNDELQMMFDTYYGPAIIKWEAGIYEKNLSDPRKCVSMCSFLPYCNTVKQLPLPKFVKIAAHT